MASSEHALAAMPSTYDHTQIEREIYTRWEESGLFRAGDRLVEEALHNRPPPSERNRRAAQRACDDGRV